MVYVAVTISIPGAIDMARQAFRKQPPLPEHDYARDHRVLRALAEFKTKRRLELAKVKRPCAEIAAERIREFAWDLGAEREWYRWIAAAQREMGFNCYSTVWAIVTGKKTRVGPDVVDQISRATGIPVAVFYDEEV
jgi:hypothetical protein